MKILKQKKRPKASKKSWWVGRQVTCPNCQSDLELEKGDDLKASTEEVHVACGSCERTLRITYSPDQPASGQEGGAA